MNSIPTKSDCVENIYLSKSTGDAEARGKKECERSISDSSTGREVFSLQHLLGGKNNLQGLLKFLYFAHHMNIEVGKYREVQSFRF